MKRKPAEESLRHGEARFRAIFENAGAGILLLDANGLIGDVNPAATAMIGRTSEDLIDRHLGELIHPADTERTLRECRELLSGGIERLSTEARVLRHDGTAFPAHITSTLARSEDGEAEWGLVILEDISSGVRAAEALRREQDRYAGIVQIAAEAIISIDVGQRIVQFNQAAERIFGWEADDVIGSPVEILMPERYRARHREHVVGFSSRLPVPRHVTGRPVTGLRRDGTEFKADVAISTFEVDHHRYFTAVLHDITDQIRREAEQRMLADAGEVLSDTLDYVETLHNIALLFARHMGDFCTVDATTDDGAIRRLAAVAADPALADRMEALRRYPPSPDKPHIALKVWHTRKPEILAAIQPDMLENMAMDDAHLELLRSLDPRSALAVPLIARERLLGVMMVVAGPGRRRFDERDLAIASDLGHRAAMAVDNARLYEASLESARARQRILGIVAHDLRSPLNGIMMAADMLLHYLEEDPNPAHRRPAQAILREADRMNKLIQDLLDVRAIEAGRLSVELLPMPARALFDDALTRYREPAEAAGIELKVGVTEDLPRVLADRERMTQVFANLIDNAIKFTPRGGHVRVAARRGEGCVRFSVTDSGQGIEPENLERIFAAFWQGVKGDRRGAGLGLSIARGIVAAHGSRLIVESVPDRGTTFSLTLRCPPIASDRSTSGNT